MPNALHPCVCHKGEEWTSFRRPSPHEGEEESIWKKEGNGAM